MKILYLEVDSTVIHISNFSVLTMHAYLICTYVMEKMTVQKEKMRLTLYVFVYKGGTYIHHVKKYVTKKHANVRLFILTVKTKIAFFMCLFVMVLLTV